MGNSIRHSREKVEVRNEWPRSGNVLVLWQQRKILVMSCCSLNLRDRISDWYKIPTSG